MKKIKKRGLGGGGALSRLFFSNLNNTTGGSKNYICGNEENYFVALPRFSRSTVAGVQMSFLSLCVSLAASLWLLSVFNTFCFVVRFLSSSFLFQEFFVRKNANLF